MWLKCAIKKKVQTRKEKWLKLSYNWHNVNILVDVRLSHHVFWTTLS
jgi:hypothetical protein